MPVLNLPGLDAFDTKLRDTDHKRSTNTTRRWSMDKWFAKVNFGSHKCKRTCLLA